MSIGRCPVPLVGEDGGLLRTRFTSALLLLQRLRQKCFGLAATATEDSAIAARCAASELIDNSGASPTAATNKAPKDDSVTGTVSGSIADAEPMPAWRIKVPFVPLSIAGSCCRPKLPRSFGGRVGRAHSPVGFAALFVAEGDDSSIRIPEMEGMKLTVQDWGCDLQPIRVRL
jgi:hypothetical protein